MNNVAIAAAACGSALTVGLLVMAADRWRIANDWRYTSLPWRRR